MFARESSRRECRGAAGVPFLEEGQSRVGRVDAPRGVEPGAEAEGDVLGGWSFARREAGFREKGAQARRPGRRERGQPGGRDRAVFAGQRDEVGDRPEAGGAQERLGREAHVRPPGDRLSDLPGDSGRGELLLGIAAAGLARVDHDRAAGQLLRDQVVVGHDDLDARPPRAIHALDRGDAAVDRDDGRRRKLGEHAPHRFGLEAVPVAEAVRDEGRGFGARATERGAQLRHGRDAVDVVVAEDDHALAAAGRRDQQVGRGLDAEHPLRRVERPVAGRQEGFRLRGIADAPAQQQPREQRRHTGLSRKAFRRAGLHGRRLPESHRSASSARRRTDRVPARPALACRPLRGVPRRLRPGRRSRSADGLESAEGAQPSIAALSPLLGGQVGDFAKVTLDRFADGRRGAGRIGVRSARRLGNDLVDDAELGAGRRP